MAQHFLLTAKARGMSLKQIFSMTEESAFDLFKECRWSGNDPVCPICGVIDHKNF